MDTDRLPVTRPYAKLSEANNVPCPVSYLIRWYPCWIIPLNTTEVILLSYLVPYGRLEFWCSSYWQPFFKLEHLLIDKHWRDDRVIVNEYVMFLSFVVVPNDYFHYQLICIKNLPNWSRNSDFMLPKKYKKKLFNAVYSNVSACYFTLE